MLKCIMQERTDERDTIFSRMFELKEGTLRYDEYYRRNPDVEANDTVLRNYAGGVFADREVEQRQIDAVFSLIADLRPLSGHSAADGSSDLNPVPLKIDPEEFSRRIKKTALSFGSLSCGITETNAEWVYSVRGRGPYYGDTVEEYLPNTIVWSVEMDETEIHKAPAVEESAEVVKAYLQAAMTGLALKRIINSWGYKAVCHMDGMSQIILPPAAEAAGIGSIGLNGILASRECGSRVRLAAVTTDLPLVMDSCSSFNIRNACRNCGRCADSCPSSSIRKYSDYKDGERFSVNQDSCFRFWREMSTDCGICLDVCPFSHPKMHISS